MSLVGSLVFQKTYRIIDGVCPISVAYFMYVVQVRVWMAVCKNYA